MNHEIFIVSCEKDFPWLRQCLRSVTRFAQGYSGCTIFIPEHEIPRFEIHPDCEPQAESGYFRIVTAPARDPGHMFQQAIKCQADLYCPRANYIHHVDSDSFFVESRGPELQFQGGLPVMPFCRYAWIETGHPGALAWKHSTERALNFRVECEFMRQMPLVYPRELYSLLRHRIESQHGATLMDYVMQCKVNHFYESFSEFNCLGALAFKWYQHLFWWSNTEQTSWDWKFQQLWSHAGLDGPQDRIGNKTGRQFVTELLGDCS